MSSRWYPLYQIGNPQLRVFLPNFWMKIVRNAYKEKEEILPNRIQFHVSMGMSRHDIINYLERIYNVSVVDVRIFIKMGATKTVSRKKYVVKEDDYKVAMVTLPDGVTFEFPDLYSVEKIQKDYKDLEKALVSEKEFKKLVDAEEKVKPGIPGWFSGKTGFKKQLPVSAQVPAVTPTPETK